MRLLNANMFVVAEIYKPVGDLLGSPDFGSVFTEWQRTRMTEKKWSGLLAEKLRGYFPEGSEDGDQSVEWYMEEADDDTFEDVLRDETAIELRNYRRQAGQDKLAARQAVVDYCQQLGISPLALYGLRVHLDEYRILSKSDLVAKTVTAQNDFERVDEFIRNNPGKLLTVVELGVYACMLGNGGISLDQRDNVMLPVANGTKCYSMGATSDSSEMYETDELALKAYKIHSHDGSMPNLYEGWAPFLNPRDLFSEPGKMTLAVGNMVDGPPNIPEGRDSKFWLTVFDRVCKVGSAALKGTSETV
jgi:hypothetical protein